MALAAVLRDRWRSTKEGRILAARVIGRLVSGEPLRDLGLAEHEGRLDLRGLPLPAAGAARQMRMATRDANPLEPLVEFDGVTLTGLDLSGAHLPHLRAFGAEVVDCRFDGADCDDLRAWGTSFTGCSFAGARLTNATLGSGSRDGRRNEWTRTDFSRALFRGAHADRAVFVDCDFSEAKLDRVEFVRCELTRCRFAGTLRDVVFDGREVPDAPASPPFLALDLSRVRFESTEFRGCELVDPRLPEDPDVRFVRYWPCVIDLAQRELAGDHSEAANDLRGILLYERYGPVLRSGSVHLLNRRDLRGYPSGETLVRLAEEVLGRCEQECLQTRPVDACPPTGARPT